MRIGVDFGHIRRCDITAFEESAIHRRDITQAVADVEGFDHGSGEIRQQTGLTYIDRKPVIFLAWLLPLAGFVLAPQAQRSESIYDPS